MTLVREGLSYMAACLSAAMCLFVFSFGSSLSEARDYYFAIIVFVVILALVTIITFPFFATLRLLTRSMNGSYVYCMVLGLAAGLVSNIVFAFLVSPRIQYLADGNDVATPLSVAARLAPGVALAGACAGAVYKMVRDWLSRRQRPD